MKLSILTILALASSPLASGLDLDTDPRVQSLAAFNKKSDIPRGVLRNIKDLPEEEQELKFAALFRKLVNVDANGKIKGEKTSNVRDFFKNISLKDVEENAEFMLRTFGFYLNLVYKDTKVAKVIDSSADNILQVVRQYKTRSGKKDLTVINPKWIPEAGKQLISELQRNIAGSNAIIHLMPPNFWAAIGSVSDEDIQADYCSVLIPPTIVLLNKESLPKVSPACFGAIEDIGKAAIENVISKLDNKIFSRVSGKVIAENAKKMKPEQLANFGIALNPEKRCTNLALHAVTPQTMKSVTGTCLASYLLGPDAQKLEKLWDSVPVNVFDTIELADFGPIAAAINPDDKEHIPKATWSKFNSYPGFAPNVQEGGAYKKSGKLELKPTDIPRLTDKKLFIAAITSHDGSALDPLFLAYVSDSFFSDISHTVNGKEFSGLKVLDLIKAKNLELVISNLSSKIETGEHACASIPDSASFHDIKALAFASDECSEATKFSPDFEDFKKSPALLKGRSWTSVSSSFGKDDLAKITKGMLSILVKGDFCYVADHETINQLNSDSLPAIDSHCLSLIPEPRKLTFEQTTRFDQKAFEDMTLDSWKDAKFTLKNVSEEQLPFLSINVENPKDMVTSYFVEKDIADLGKRVSRLVAKQIASLNNKSLAALPIEEISGKALVSLGPEQIKVLIPSFKKMSPDQVKLIGSSHSDRKGVNKVISDNAKLFTKEAQIAWTEREASSNSAITLTPTISLLALFAVAALLL